MSSSSDTNEFHFLDTKTSSLLKYFWPYYLKAGQIYLLKIFSCSLSRSFQAFTPSLSLRSQSDFHFGHRRNFTISWFWAELKLTWLAIAAILKTRNTTTPEEFQLIDTSFLSSTQDQFTKSVGNLHYISFILYAICARYR